MKTDRDAGHSFIIREDSQKAAWHHGFRRELGESDGWAAFESTTAQGTIWLAADAPHGPWYLAIDHRGAHDCFPFRVGRDETQLCNCIDCSLVEPTCSQFQLRLLQIEAGPVCVADEARLSELWEKAGLRHAE
jgi:hypothetical protein